MFLAITTALSVECLVVGTFIVNLWRSLELNNAITNQQKSCLVWNQKRMEDIINKHNQLLQQNNEQLRK